MKNESISQYGEMEYLFNRAKVIAGGREVSMLRLREWVLEKGEYPQDIIERNKLEIELEDEIDKVIKRNEWE